MRNLFSCLLAVLFIGVSVAQAQVPPPPAGVSFTDADPTARIFFPKVASELGRSKLDRHVERYPEDPRGWSARAFAESLRGKQEAAIAHLARAHALIGGDPRRHREVLWSSGWIQLTLGDFDRAAEAWVSAVKLHGGRPYWVPYSFSALAELAGQPDVALAWYSVAVDDAPRTWGRRQAMVNKTRHWHPREREAIRRVYEAWTASREG